jgi:DnaK suppressor protein
LIDEIQRVIVGSLFAGTDATSTTQTEMTGCDRSREKTREAAVMKDNQKAGADAKMSRARYNELKQMLSERRREIQAEVQGKMRGVREEGTWGGKLNEVLDAVESAEADIQEDLEFALVQMKSETLNKINDALGRLEQGDYGYCYDCGEEIAEKRLRALPFAVRCKDCEEAKENAEQRERQHAARRGAAALFLDM